MDGVVLQRSCGHDAVSKTRNLQRVMWAGWLACIACGAMSLLASKYSVLLLMLNHQTTTRLGHGVLVSGDVEHPSTMYEVADAAPLRDDVTKRSSQACQPYSSVSPASSYRSRIIGPYALRLSLSSEGSRNLRSMVCSRYLADHSRRCRLLAT